jgi:hypothetical protein
MTGRIVMLNRALLRIGAEPLVSEADPGAPVHLAVFDSVLELFSAAPWSFLKATRRLVRLTAPPDGLYQYAYQLPSDRMGPPRAVYASADVNRRPLTAYDIQGDQLLADEAQIWATIVAVSSWEKWPGDFREAFITALMAELALSVREDRVLHRELYAKAFGPPSAGGLGGLFGMSLDRDSQGIPSTVVGGGANPLIDVRF